MRPDPQVVALQLHSFNLLLGNGTELPFPPFSPPQSTTDGGRNDRDGGEGGDGRDGGDGGDGGGNGGGEVTSDTTPETMPTRRTESKTKHFVHKHYNIMKHLQWMVTPQQTLY